jgi:hypothetical protein
VIGRSVCFFKGSPMQESKGGDLIPSLLALVLST